MNICDRVQPDGVIVQFGGQTPLNLARALHTAGVPIIGTSVEMIEAAEDREKFQALLRRLRLKQPANGIARTMDQARAEANKIGYPALVRPSYVLGGRAMEICYDQIQLEKYVKAAFEAADGQPVLIDRFLEDAIEVDVDCIFDGKTAMIAGVMEHIEEAGVHSGDSACVIPPYSLSGPVVTEIRTATEAMARELNVKGLMNVQFAVKIEDGQPIVYVLEVNPRASRTVPFVAKATGVPIAKIAARLMAGELLAGFGLGRTGAAMAPAHSHVAIKEAVFPFARFPGVDTILGPEMKSTGEVMGLDKDFGHAFAKSQLGGGTKVPVSGRVFISVRDRDKASVIDLARRLSQLGFEIVATRGTARALEDQEVPVRSINKVLEGRPHIVDAMANNEIHLVFNTTEGVRSIADSYSLRRTALTQSIPYYTTIAGARAALMAIEAMSTGGLEVAPLQSYFNTSF